MFKRILLAAGVLILAIGSAIAFYVYLMTQTRPPLESAPANYTCHFAQREACEKANLWLQERYKNFPIPSISAAITIEGKQVWSGTVGLADIANNTPAQLDTLYQIGSISKSLTAALTLKLQEQSKVNIQSNFQDYVSDYAVGKHDNYTLVHLLSHQSGIRHYKDELSESLNETAYENTRAAAEIVEQDALLFTPGNDFLYTSYGYSVLALALEAASGRDYPTLIEQELLKPLGLTHTRLNTINHLANGETVNMAKATPYLVLGSDLIFEAPQLNYSNKFAGAGFLSTPSDLLIFANALLRFDYLNESSINSMFTPVPLSLINADVDKSTSVNPQNYALGFRVDEGNFGKVVHHGGTINGGYSFLALYPQQQAALAFAMNAVPPSSPDASFDRQASSEELLSYFLSKN